jgi:hypothetical protein
MRRSGTFFPANFSDLFLTGNFALFGARLTQWGNTTFSIAPAGTPVAWLRI